MYKKFKITYKSVKSGRILECVGEVRGELNNESSDRWVVVKEDGSYEDIYKSTVRNMEEIAE